MIHHAEGDDALNIRDDLPFFNISLPWTTEVMSSNESVHPVEEVCRPSLFKMCRHLNIWRL